MKEVAAKSRGRKRPAAQPYRNETLGPGELADWHSRYYLELLVSVMAGDHPALDYVRQIAAGELSSGEVAKLYIWRDSRTRITLGEIFQLAGDRLRLDPMLQDVGLSSRAAQSAAVIGLASWATWTDGPPVDTDRSDSVHADRTVQVQHARRLMALGSGRCSADAATGQVCGRKISRAGRGGRNQRYCDRCRADLADGYPGGVEKADTNHRKAVSDLLRQVAAAVEIHGLPSPERHGDLVRFDAVPPAAGSRAR